LELAALKEKHYAVAKALLIHGRVDSESFEDALYYAAQHCQDDLVSLLLQKNSHPVFKMTNLGTALHAACIGYLDGRFENQVRDPKLAAYSARRAGADSSPPTATRASCSCF
jgi:hypothetical protein